MGVMVTAPALVWNVWAGAPAAGSAKTAARAVARARARGKLVMVVLPEFVREGSPWLPRLSIRPMPIRYGRFACSRGAGNHFEFFRLWNIYRNGEGTRLAPAGAARHARRDGKGRQDKAVGGCERPDRTGPRQILHRRPLRRGPRGPRRLPNPFLRPRRIDDPAGGSLRI